MEKSNSKKITIPSFSIGIPKIGKTEVLVVLLIIASYFFGSYTAKLQFSKASTGVNNQVAQQQAQAPIQPQQQAQQPPPSIDGKKVEIEAGKLPVRGNSSAKVTLVEFADFRCPFCEKFYTDVEQQLVKDYIDTGKVKLSYRHYAFLGEASLVAANASECANEQNKFWEMHDYLYENQPSESDTSLYTTEKLTQVAGTLGVNTAQFKSCLDGKKYDQNVKGDLSAGQTAGVQGTPTVFVNGVAIVGAQPYTAFKTAIDNALQ